MTEAESGAYLAARVLSCGIWIAAGGYKWAHFERTTREMAHLGIPLPRIALPIVLALEFGGSAMLIFDYYVWAAALAWIIFTIPASIIYHFRFMVREGTIDFVQFLLGWKNVSIIGGLIALILLDQSRPAWLFGGA
ncbi:MAG: DoxX family protein [Burkholderiales bacterium]|nr:DoxX family protein [Burkholderiales bacterium]